MASTMARTARAREPLESRWMKIMPALRPALPTMGQPWISALPRKATGTWLRSRGISR